MKLLYIRAIRIKGFLAVFILCAFSLGFILLNVGAFREIKNTFSADADDFCIVVDAGHGGEDGGAQSAAGLLEKGVNLAIAKELSEMLKLSGYRVVMTRETDTDLGDKSLETIRERKVSDLHNRAELVNREKNTILISIHQNFFEQSQYSGSQIFYAAGNQESPIIAEEIRKEIITLLQPENKRESKPAGDSIYLLKKVQCPAVIVECGFLSNPAEAEKLSDAQYQKQMAFSIYLGIMKYLSAN